VATVTVRAPLARARSHTWTTMGLPRRVASGLPGNLVEA